MADKPYSFVMARHGIVGVTDKLCQFEAMAEVWGGKQPPGAIVEKAMVEASANREFRELVIRVIKPHEHPSLEDQVCAWEDFCESRPYFREPGEVIANPLETAKRGGDCDDLVVLLLAGYYAMGVEHAKAQIAMDNKGNGYHIRALCPYPLVGPPEGWRVVDPVWHSEFAWAKGQGDKFREKYANKPVQLLPASAVAGAEGQQSEPKGIPNSWIVGAAVLSGYFLWKLIQK